ncbi:MAG: gamma carbonic anhydrase family protein [Pseudohongiellaceae bacterium]
MSIRGFQEHRVRVDELAFVDSSAEVIGNVIIGKDSSVWPTAVIRGDVNQITIGERTSIQDGCVLHVSHKSEDNPEGHPLRIGNDVTVGHRVILHGCRVGNRVLIGMGSIIMDGVVVPDEVVIAAGSLVSPGKQLESGYLYLGAPAKRARPLTEEEKQFFRYSADHYVKLKNLY